MLYSRTMSQTIPENDFDNLLRVAIPLIIEHIEPNFDMLLSRWMGKCVHEEYIVWKDSRLGAELPRGDQIRYLLTIWRKHVGEVANVRGFISLLQQVQGINSTFNSGSGKFPSTVQMLKTWNPQQRMTN